MVKRYLLMIPGPVPLYAETLQEMGATVVPHYGRQWVGLYEETVGMLKQVFQTKQDVYVLVGSGTAGLDAGIGSILKRGEKALVLINGGFAQRLLRIARAYDIDARVLEFDLLHPIPVEAVREFVQKERVLKAILMVHHETHTGVVNPVREVGQLAKEHDLLLLVDAISSLGGIEMEVEEWGIDICVTASQKCLEAPPGLAIVSISKHAWEAMEAKAPTGHGFYLDLLIWREYSEKWGDWHPSPVTMATNNILALRVSLKRILDEGLGRRFARYRRVSKVIRTGLRSIKLEPLLPDAHWASPTVTAFKTPAGIAPDNIRSFLLDKHNIMVSFGPPAWRDCSLRVGHMGRGTELDHIIPLLWGLEEALRHHGVEVALGRSLIGLRDFWKNKEE